MANGDQPLLMEGTRQAGYILASYTTGIICRGGPQPCKFLVGPGSPLPSVWSLEAGVAAEIVVCDHRDS